MHIESKGAPYSISIVVEIRIFDILHSKPIFKVNMTGWRTECTSTHEEIDALFLFDASWNLISCKKEFYLNMRIIDLVYPTQEKSRMVVTDGKLWGLPNSNIHLYNVEFMPFDHYRHSAVEKKGKIREFP
ncbi:hypothetical protein RF11_14374 [Thelohanellus kitauei]|uniref:Uncharacterized protein n=1 Tax=Thelohanellus kitauei TaxID=669202 RepID=A0A0C2N2S8_THEKT|nr:hypothetical protein RF11_14374 [Thelohanellus kitauei]